MSKTLDQYSKEANADLTLRTVGDVETFLKRSGLVRSKFLGYLSKERAKLKLLEINLDSVRGNRYNHYKFNHDIILDKRDDINAFISKDEEYIKARKSMVMQQEIVEYLKETVETIKSMGYSLNSHVRLFLFNQGEQNDGWWIYCYCIGSGVYILVYAHSSIKDSEEY